MLSTSFSFKVISVLNFFIVFVLKEQFTKSENLYSNRRVMKYTDRNSPPNALSWKEGDVTQKVYITVSHSPWMSRGTNWKFHAICCIYISYSQVILKGNLSGVSVNLNSICDSYTWSFKILTGDKFWLNKVFLIHKIYCRWQVQYTLLVQAKSKKLCQECYMLAFSLEQSSI